MKQQSGFTLIELIAVIVILGILAATALPRFVDMSSAAEDSALKGTAANLSSAMALNYANAAAKAAGLTVTGTITAVANCTDASALLQGGALPSGYTIDALAIGSLGLTVTCKLKFTKGSTVKSADFQGIGVPTANAQ